MRRLEPVYKSGHIPWAGGVVYLASVFRKHPVGLWRAYDEARRAQGALLHAGVPVFSPIACYYSTAVFTEELDVTDHEFWMDLNRRIMRRMQCLVVLQQPGWKESEGIAEEIKFFADRNSPIYSLDYPVVLD